MAGDIPETARCTAQYGKYPVTKRCRWFTGCADQQLRAVRRNGVNDVVAIELGKSRDGLPAGGRHLPRKHHAVHPLVEIDPRAIGEQGYRADGWGVDMYLVSVEGGVSQDARRRVARGHDRQDGAQNDEYARYEVPPME